MHIRKCYPDFLWSLPLLDDKWNPLLRCVSFTFSASSFYITIIATRIQFWISAVLPHDIYLVNANMKNCNYCSRREILLHSFSQQHQEKSWEWRKLADDSAKCFFLTVSSHVAVRAESEQTQKHWSLLTTSDHRWIISEEAQRGVWMGCMCVCVCVGMWGCGFCNHICNGKLCVLVVLTEELIGILCVWLCFCKGCSDLLYIQLENKETQYFSPFKTS